MIKSFSEQKCKDTVMINFKILIQIPKISLRQNWQKLEGHDFTLKETFDKILIQLSINLKT